MDVRTLYFKYQLCDSTGSYSKVLEISNEPLSVNDRFQAVETKTFIKIEDGWHEILNSLITDPKILEWIAV